MAKIDKEKLNDYLRSGKSPAKIAEIFGVSRAAVSKYIKRTKKLTTREVILESAHKITQKNINAFDQLQKINDYANELLDLLMRWNRGEDEALQVLESQITTKKVRVGNKEQFIEELKFKDPRELALKAMAEIRGQLSLQLDILKSLYDFQAAQEFQEEVLNIIGEISPKARNEIIKRLKERRALRRSAAID